MQVSQLTHFSRSQVMRFSSSREIAPAGHFAMHMPQSMHRLIVSGLWQNRQLKWHPWKKTDVRLPGPSTLENEMILLIGALVAMFLDPAVQSMCAVLGAFAEYRYVVQ